MKLVNKIIPGFRENNITSVLNYKLNFARLKVLEYYFAFGGHFWKFS